MIIVSYDISDTKLRTKFSKYLLRFGRRMQYSVYEIDNSPRILENIMADVRDRFMPEFSESDSVLLLNLSQNCDIIRMGNAVHDDEDIIIV